MNKRLKKKLIAALRSGEYRQGSSYLAVEEPGGDKFCCLGVACELLVQEQQREWDGAGVLKIEGTPIKRWKPLSDSDSMPTEEALEMLDMSLEEAEKLASMNDNGKSFNKIADYIEEKL